MDVIQILKARYPYLSEDKLAEILGMGEMVLLQEGDVFIKAGERNRKIGFVLHGILRNYMMNDSGEEVTVVFATEMQAISTYSSIFLDKPSSETSVAVETTLLFVVDFAQFKKKAGSDPLFLRVYAELTEQAFVAAIQRIEDFTNKNPVQRYQRLLDNHGFLIERVPLKYLASYLGITAVSLSRIRKRLSKNRN